MFRFSLSILFVLFATVSISESSKNNVCKTLLDYISIDFNNKNCWYNPDVGSSASDIIKRRGLPLEIYEFQTEDGYLNAIYRIPHNNTHRNDSRQPVLLHGGLGGGPSSFLNIGDKSMAFYLVNNGYDIWLSNRRGSAFGKGHIKYNRTDPEFWDYSYHECGYYDIKAELDFIKTKNPRKAILIGYSMGTTETFVYGVLRKKHSKRHVAGIVALGATAYLSHANYLVIRIASSARILENILRSRKVYGLYDSFETKESKEQVITLSKLIAAKQGLLAVVGDSTQIAAADLPVYVFNRPSSISVKAHMHYAQNIISGGKFQQYDYGPEKNLAVYNATTPTQYNVSDIEVPVYLFYGDADTVTPTEDVLKFYNQLRVKRKGMIHISEDRKVKFNHIDFVLAKDVDKLLHPVLLRMIRKNMRG